MIPARCAVCTVRISPATSPVPGTEMHCARGLCSGCYGRKRVSGRYLDFPTRLRPRDYVMEEWDLLRSQGYTKRQAADRLGMTFEAFDRAFHRARRAGDPRARVPGERLVAS